MKRIVSLILCVFLTVGIFSGCQNNETAHIPTGDALVMDDGNLAGNAPQNTVQELKLTYYPGKSMNPLQSSDFTNRVLFSLIYQGLFAVDRNYNTEPMLCKEYSVSQDMKTYVFYLEDATFSDGSALTNTDVVATLNSARSSGYYSGRFGHIKSISASGENSVTVTVDTPMENLPILLDMPILKSDQVKAEFPLGTGPYIWDGTGGTPLLRQRDNWWCKNSTLLVSAPAISLTPAESNPQIRDEFEFNGLNLVCANPGSDKYADYRCDYELWNSENGEFLYLLCNMESEIFSVASVRAALTHAIDRETIAQEFRGFGQPASLPASPSSPYYSEVQAEKYAYDGGTIFNQAVAGANLVGKPLVFLVNGDDTMRARIARTIHQALTSAGFVVEMKELSGKSYRNALARKEFDLYLGQTRLSPNMDLTPFFKSKGALSHGGIADVAIYALCLEALANHGNYYSLHQAVMDDGRLCPVLFSSYAVYATRGLMTGLAPSRDNVFFYSLGKTMEGSLRENQ